MKKIVALVLALMLALSMLTVATAETANPVAGKKVAYIMLLPSATIFQMWKDSCADLCAALDVEFDFYFCDGDFNRWMDTINTCAAAGYDGLLVSHGNQDGSYVFLKELTEKYPELKLVCFDTQFYTDGEYQKIEGDPAVPAGQEPGHRSARRDDRQVRRGRASGQGMARPQLQQPV